MLETKLLLILPLVVAVTVGQTNQGYEYYGTSNAQNQRPQPIYGNHPLRLPMRPVLHFVNAAAVAPAANSAPVAPVESAPVINQPAAPAVSAAPVAPSYAAVPQPTLYSAGYRPRLPSSRIEQVPTPIAAPGLTQPPVVVEAATQPPVTEIASLQSVEASNTESPMLPEPTVEQLDQPLSTPEAARAQTGLRAARAQTGLRAARAQTGFRNNDIYQPATQPASSSMAPIVAVPQMNSYPQLTIATAAPSVVSVANAYSPVTTGNFNVDFQCQKGNAYYSVKNECDTYIECKQNKATKYSCPDGLHFNPAAKHFEYPCAYPSEVKCEAGAEEQSPKPTDKCPNQYGYYSMDDGDCSKFIMCQEGLATIMDCPIGLVFNPQTSSCDWPANVPQCNSNVFKDFTCPDPPKDEFGRISDIIYHYRYGGQCKLYIACQLGHPRLLSCDRGLSFDDASQSCIDEDYVKDCEAN